MHDIIDDRQYNVILYKYMPYMVRSLSEGYSLFNLHQTFSAQCQDLPVPLCRPDSPQPIFDDQFTHFPIGDIPNLDFTCRFIEQEEIGGSVGTVRRG